MDPVVQHHELARLDAQQGHGGRHQRAPRSVYRCHRCPRDSGVRILGVIAEAARHAMGVEVAPRPLVDVLAVALCGVGQHHPGGLMQLADHDALRHAAGVDWIDLPM